MMKLKLLFYLFLLFTHISCSTMSKSLVTAGATGTVAGFASSRYLIKGSKAKHQVVGSAIGLGVGLASGYLLYKKSKKKEDRVRRETLFNLEKFGVDSIPKNSNFYKSISKPVVKEQWIDTKVQGQKLIEGHRVWIIEENSKWKIK